MGESIEREKAIDVNVTVGSVLDSLHVGPLLITNRPAGVGVCVKELTVLIGLSDLESASTVI